MTRAYGLTLHALDIPIFANNLEVIHILRTVLILGVFAWRIVRLPMRGSFGV